LIATLSLHDALPIWLQLPLSGAAAGRQLLQSQAGRPVEEAAQGLVDLSGATQLAVQAVAGNMRGSQAAAGGERRIHQRFGFPYRSEEHTSALQSREK